MSWYIIVVVWGGGAVKRSVKNLRRAEIRIVLNPVEPSNVDFDLQ